MTLRNEEDGDLQDLIQEDGKPSTTGNTKKYKYSNYYNHKIPSQKSHIIFRIPELLCYLLTSFFLKNPFLGRIAVLGLLAFIIISVASLPALGKQQTIGEIKYDFATSKYDFDIGKIDHWCVVGGDECDCPDPLNPTPRIHKSWFKAFARHKTLIEKEPNPDVVFLGQTLVEAMNGEINGHDMSDSQYFGKVKNVFHRNFEVTNGNSTGVVGIADNEEESQENDVDIKATAMGLTGDASANVLWRLMNGALPDNFNPPVWWIVVGLEDVGRYGCSEEITVMGILRIVEEIQERRPDAKIVINSLLPMVKMRMKKAEDEEEFVDAERSNGKGPHRKDKRGKRGRDRKRKRRDNDRQRNLKRNDDEETDSENPDQEKIIQNMDRLKRKRMREIAKRKKKYREQVDHDKFNPRLRDVKHWKKKGRHPNSRIPMWTAVHTINKELHRFAERTKHVSFFDVTTIFAITEEDGGFVLSSDHISPRGHPTLKGFKKWLQAAAAKVKEITKKDLEKKRTEQKQTDTEESKPEPTENKKDEEGSKDEKDDGKEESKPQPTENEKDGEESKDGEDSKDEKDDGKEESKPEPTENEKDGEGSKDEKHAGEEEKEKKDEDGEESKPESDKADEKKETPKNEEMKNSGDE